MSTAYRHFLKVLEKWPADPLRPHISFQNIQGQRMEKLFRDKNPLWTEDIAMKKVLPLERLLANELKKKYPLSAKTMEPASNPNYYTRLLKEIHRTSPLSRMERIRSWFR